MICESCKRAGKFNADANRIAFYSVANAEIVRKTAQEWHACCSDIKCGCQHIIGDVINRSRVKRDENGKADPIDYRRPSGGVVSGIADNKRRDLGTA